MAAVNGEDEEIGRVLWYLGERQETLNAALQAELAELIGRCGDGRGVVVAESEVAASELRALGVEDCDTYTHKEIMCFLEDCVDVRAREVLYGENRQISFGKKRTLQQELDVEAEDEKMRCSFIDAWHRFSRKACFDRSLPWPQATRAVISEENDYNPYGREYSFLIVWGLPPSLQELHALNMICARHRFCLVLDGDSMPSDVLYGFTLTSARAWNPANSSQMFSHGYRSRSAVSVTLPTVSISLFSENSQPIEKRAFGNLETELSENNEHEEEEEKEERPRKKRKKPKRRPPFADRFKPLAPAFRFEHAMPDYVYAGELQVYNTRNYEKAYQLGLKNASQRSKFSLIVTSMASDRSRFHPAHTLIITSHFDCVEFLETAYAFLEGARIVVSRNYAPYTHAIDRNEPSKLAYRISQNKRYPISINEALVNVNRIVIGDPYAVMGEKMELVLATREMSPKAIVTCVYYQHSYDSALVQQLMTTQEYIGLKRCAMLAKNAFDQPVLSSAMAPSMYDEEVMARKPAAEIDRANYMLGTLIAKTDSEEINRFILDNNYAPYLHCLVLGNGKRSRWVALPAMLLDFLYDWIRQTCEMMVFEVARGKESVVRIYHSVAFRSIRQSHAKTELVESETTYPRRYRMTQKASPALDELKNAMPTLRHYFHRGVDIETFTEMFGDAYVERTRDGETFERFALDHETLWAMREEKYITAPSMMPDLRRQLELVSYFGQNARKNTLMLFAAASEHASLFDCRDQPGEVALMTHDRGLVGYTDPGIVIPVILDHARRSNIQQFMEFAPPYARREVFEEVNRQLNDRKIMMADEHRCGWNAYTLEVLPDGRRDAAFQRDLSNATSTTLASASL